MTTLQQQLLVARPMTVLSPVISSLAGAVRAYFEGVFPPGYFSSRFTDTEFPARPGVSRRRRFRPMTYSQISAFNTPLLTVKVDRLPLRGQLVRGQPVPPGSDAPEPPYRR